MDKEKKKIRKRRNPKGSIPFKPTEMYQVECPVCGTMVSNLLLMSIRGEIKCNKCIHDSHRDYMEENRRRIEKIANVVLSVDWKGKK